MGDIVHATLPQQCQALWSQGLDLMRGVVGVREDQAVDAPGSLVAASQEHEARAAAVAVRYDVHCGGGLAHPLDDILPHVGHVPVGGFSPRHGLAVNLVLIGVEHNDAIACLCRGADVREHCALLQVLVDAEGAAPDTNPDPAAALDEQEELVRRFKTFADKYRGLHTAACTKWQGQRLQLALRLEQRSHILENRIGQCVVMLLVLELEALVSADLEETATAKLVTQLVELLH
mmetsp:Transcript_64707/g.183651  ORF Transcript_64707/g.183651 Transcript_64707/m.183651 type:complete len:233 (+) Transcript_64707:482-1180(+)